MGSWQLNSERKEVIQSMKKAGFSTIQSSNKKVVTHEIHEPSQKANQDSTDKKNDVCDQTQNNQTYEYSICNIQQSGFDAERTILTTKWLLQSGPADAMS